MRKFKSAAIAALFFLSMPVTFAASQTEDFQKDPLTNGWKIFGDADLFRWDSTNQNVAVTWDSSRRNSYFYQPLAAGLTSKDDFSLSFDLRMSDFKGGADPQMPGPFSLSIGLLNRDEAMQESFLRGTGYTSPDLVEFDFFPDPGGNWTYGPSLTEVMVDQTGFNWGYGTEIEGLTVDEPYRITLNHAANSSLVMTITRSGAPFGQVVTTSVNTNFTDFYVDTISISSYSQAGQDTNSYDGVVYAGSILAHGTVDNIVTVLPEPSISALKGFFKDGTWQAQFTGLANWNYALEGSPDFQTWTEISSRVAGLNGTITLLDTNQVASRFFYRIRATHP
jgi:hypothetical protein